MQHFYLIACFFRVRNESKEERRIIHGHEGAYTCTCLRCSGIGEVYSLVFHKFHRSTILRRGARSLEVR